MTRFKISYALAVLGVTALFAIFILFRNDAARIGAEAPHQSALVLSQSELMT